MCVPVVHSSWSARSARSSVRTSAEWRCSCESVLGVELDQLTYAVVLALDVFQIVALLALAEVAAEGVHALPVVRAEVLPSDAFVNI